jgi:hypothetical protein
MANLPMKLRMMIFKIKTRHFNERKDKLSELFKGKPVKVIETANVTELYIYIENK